MSPQPLLTEERATLSAFLGESHFREYKSGLHGTPDNKCKRPATEICRDIAATLVAFANADGGELLVGVEDSGEITGLDAFSPAELDLMLRCPKSHIHSDTPLTSVIGARTKISGKTVLYYSIPKSQSTIHLTADGKCIQRKDLESVPVGPKQIELERHETRSREYDREFVDGASLAALEIELIQSVADQISPGMSPEKCLQYLGLADFDPPAGLRLRRAAMLLFAKHSQNYHPRLQVRILNVSGTELGTGAKYNVTTDVTVRNNILRLLGEAWDQLRSHLVQTKLGGSARFEVTYMYPEHACREALVNAIAHRDYSDEGKGIEIYVYNDRIEVKNPGGLVSPVTVDDLKAMKGIHQSRNSYLSRTLREVGYMRELGEGIRRIFELMKSSELALPHIESDRESFSLSLYHRPMYSPDEVLWLDQYESFGLSLEQKAIVLLGRKGGLIAPQDIWDRLGLVDTEHYRRLVHSLQEIGVLESARPKGAAQAVAKREKIPVRAVPRFRIQLAKDIQNKHTLADRKKPVSIAKIANVQSAENSTIFVGNLPPVVTKRDMVMSFQAFGEIANVHIPMNGKVTRGYGFVEFESAEAATHVLAKRPIIKMGPYTVVVRAALPRIKHER